MHDDIRKFYMDGTFSDNSNIVAQKEKLIEALEKRMKDNGYVTALDIAPQFTLDYKPESELYEYMISIYGIFVGKDRAWQVSGMMDGKEIPRYTQSPK